MIKKDKSKNLAPRIAFSPDSKHFFFDAEGDVLKPKGVKEISPEGDLIWEKNITVRFYKKNPCQIWFHIDNQWYCFRLDCQTGAFLGMCA
jgi:hypothetical protein